MGFWFLGFLGLAGAVFIVWLTRGSRKAGEDSVLARQSKDAGKARRNAQEAESRVDGMSDDELRERMRERSKR